MVDNEQIENVVNKIINQKYLWVFPKRNSFIYPTGQIKKTLATELKRLKNISVNVDANDLQTLNIKVGEYDGKYLYYGNAIPEILTIQQCYFLDSDGYIFDEAPYFSGEVYFKFYGNLNSDNPIGASFSRENFKNIISFKESIEKMNLKPIVFYTEDNEDGNIYLSSTAKMPNAPKIIFKLNGDYTKLVENLQSAITTEPLKTKINQNLSSMSYIDLRYGNKVYFK